MNIHKIYQYYEKYVNPGEKRVARFFSHGKDIFLKGKGTYIFTDKQNGDTFQICKI